LTEIPALAFCQFSSQVLFEQIPAETSEMHCFTAPAPSVFRIRIRLASWIQIRIRNVDPDPLGVKLAKTMCKNGAKRQKIHHKKLN
jgi:hypothetical protein